MPGSPNLAFATANAGRAHALLRDFDAAIPLLQSALDIFREKLPEHWALGSAQWRLGQCLAETGRIDDGERLIAEGLAVVEAHWGPDNERTQAARTALDSVRRLQQSASLDVDRRIPGEPR